MNRRNSDTNIRDSVSDTKKSIFLNKHATVNKRIANGVPIFSASLIGIAFSVLLVVLTLAPSVLVRRGGSVTAFTESIATFANTDCATPKSSWNLGETACAVATGTPNDRRIQWVAPDGTVAQLTNFFSGTATDHYTLKTGSDPLAQPGTWTVETVSPSGGAAVAATFVVHDPATPSVDLSVVVYGPSQTSPGNNISNRVELKNNGPDDAASVALSSSVPSNTTFVSEAQNSGPAFSCAGPPGGSASGSITCTIATLPANSIAVFTFVFNVNGGTADGTLVTGRASVSSTTRELHSADNTSTFSTIVSSPAAPSCTISCPANITANNDPNQCSAVVTYTTPTPSGNCTDPDTGQVPSVNCNPPSGSAFPVGTTTVVCSVGPTDCTFTVTVNDTRPPTQPTITCPANQTATEDPPGSRSAVVNYPPPTTTGNCVTVNCNPPSGSSFRIGTTTVTCTGTDSSNNTVTCTFTVTVNSACPFTCPANINQNNDPNQCGAVVNYATPTTSGSCTITCSPASGTFFPVGTTSVTCSNGIGDSCSFTVTVKDTQPPVITTCPASRTVPPDTNCQAAVPNVTGEVVASDNCTPAGSLTITQSPAAGTLVGVGTTTITITVKDASGNSTTCTTNFTVTGTPSVLVSVTPTTAARGSTVTATGAFANCASTAQTVTLVFNATTPCSPPTVFGTVGPFTLQPGERGSRSSPFTIPSFACTGLYTLTVDLYVGGTKVATSSTQLTVTP